MNNLLKSLLIIFSMLLHISNFAQTAQRKTIKYYEKSQDASSVPFSNILLAEKSKRLSNSKGNIVMLYDEVPEDSILTAINVARELWEAKLTTSVPIYFYVLFEPLPTDIAMSAEVSIYENEAEELHGLPTALVSQINGRPVSDRYTPDCYIILNPDIKWNCRFNDADNLSCNLTTMVLRGLARGLGFGTSLTDWGNGLEYYMGFPSTFDTMIYRGDKHITDYKQKSKEMLDFVQSGNFKFRTKTNEYSLYSPSIYNKYMSFNYLEDGNSLMSYNLANGNIVLSIDDKTIDILNTIGWELPESTLKIKCNDISSDGIGSSYTKHTFSLANKDENISAYSWSFSLKQDDGRYRLVSTNNTAEFTIDKISNTNGLYINTNGDIDGRIDCTYILDGVQYSAPSFSVSLELKPIIMSVSEMVKTEKDFKLFLEFNVNYRGADKLKIEIEEDFNSSLRTTWYNEPFIAHVKTGLMTSLYYSWVTIVVSNKYGTAYYTIENEPMYKPEVLINDILTSNNVDASVQIYDVQGHEIFTGTQSDFEQQTLNKGIYIIKRITKDGYPIISKIKI